MDGKKIIKVSPIKSEWRPWADLTKSSKNFFGPWPFQKNDLLSQADNMNPIFSNQIVES